MPKNWIAFRIRLKQFRQLQFLLVMYVSHRNTPKPLWKAITGWGIGYCQPATIRTMDILRVPESCVAEGTNTSEIDIGWPEYKQEFQMYYIFFLTDHFEVMILEQNN